MFVLANLYLVDRFLLRLNLVFHNPKLIVYLSSDKSGDLFISNRKLCGVAVNIEQKYDRQKR